MSNANSLGHKTKQDYVEFLRLVLTYLHYKGRYLVCLTLNCSKLDISARPSFSIEMSSIA